MSSATARVVVKRLVWPLGDPFRKYTVYIDGTAAGNIRRRESKTFEVPAGSHMIHVRLSWVLFTPSLPRRSPDMYVDLLPGTRRVLICKAAATFWVLQGYRTDNHITLVPESPAT